MIKKFTAENGIRVVFERMESIRSVAIGVWARAGSRYELAEHNGISHFIEHMLFKGTQRRTTRQIAEEIDFIGGQMNAFTAKDCTCYHVKTLDNRISVGVDVLSDILAHSKLDEADMEIEREVILEEISELEDSPDELAHDLLAEGVWKRCGLGRPVMGRPDTIARVDGGVMRGYFKERYTPDNIVISVAGSFEEDGLRAMIEREFGDFAPGGEVRADKKAAGPSPDSAYKGAAFDAGVFIRQKDAEQVHLCVGFEGVEMGCDDIYALHLVDSVFGGGVSSVLNQKIREELGLAYSIFSYLSAYRGAGLYSVYAGTRPERAAALYDKILDEITAFKKSGMTPELLERAKEQFKSGFLMGLESPGARMSSMGKSELLLGYINAPDEITSKIEAVTLDDAYRVTDSVFNPDKLAVSAVGRVNGPLEAALGRR